MTLPSGLVGPVTISRPDAPGSFSGGTWTPATRSDVVVTGLVHAEKDKDIIERDGGGYPDGVIKVYSDEAVYAEQKSTLTDADRLTHNGKLYEVYQVNFPYSNLSLDHYRARARRIEEKENGA